MTEMMIGPWKLEVDVDATRRAYDETDSGAEGCGCLYCRNFVALREQVFPQEFIRILEKLGVDYRKDIEIYETHKKADGTYGYGGWYHAVGTILSGPSEHFEVISETFGYQIRNKAHLVQECFPRPLFQIEFFTFLPWVLEERPPVERVE